MAESNAKNDGRFKEFEATGVLGSFGRAADRPSPTTPATRPDDPWPRRPLPPASVSEQFRRCDRRCVPLGPDNHVREGEGLEVLAHVLADLGPHGQ